MFQRTIKYDLCSNGLATSSVQFMKKVQTNAEAFAKWHLYMCNALWVKVRYYYVRHGSINNYSLTIKLKLIVNGPH